MKIRVIIVLLTVILSYINSSEGQTVKEINKEIKNQKDELRKVKNEKQSTIKKLKIIESKKLNYKKKLTEINKRIVINNKNITKIVDNIRKIKININLIRKEISKSNIFIIDNMGYSSLKIITSGTKAEDIIKSLEILTKANSSLILKIKELESYIKRLNILVLEEQESLTKLKNLKQDKEKILTNINKENKAYKDTLTILQHDEAGRKEYLELLNFQRKELEDKIKKTNSFKKNSDNNIVEKLKGKLKWPVNGRIIESYGKVLVKEAKITYFHKGIKIKPYRSSNIINCLDGEVIFADYMKGFDNLIILSHIGEYYTIYGNLTDIDVKLGEKVKAGTSLGRIELDQKLNTSYLYFEIRRNENALNPIKWFRKR